MRRVVILVDSKSRDLMGDALIAHHLERRGIDCRLEPLASWRSCIPAWKPDFILFNHLNALHLADLSIRCRDSGILTGILPNEGIFYVDGDLAYSSRKIHQHMHCDRMFCWNELHRRELIKNGFCADPDHVIAVGVPRFDFYKRPWRKLFEEPPIASNRPIVLVNANFPLAHFNDLPPEDVDRFFAPWKDEIPVYADYWNAVRGNRDARIQFLRHVEALLDADRYHVIVRPHPRENPSFYRKWEESLTAQRRKHLIIADKENITSLIINCDVEISCENCTTTLEAWIAGKPTVSLTFQKHPFFYTPEVGRLLPECDSPDNLPRMVDEALAHPRQEEYSADRNAHMEKWLYSVDGNAALRVANEIAAAIDARPREKSIKLGISDIRRGIKVHLARALGEPSNTRPTFMLRRRLQLDESKPTQRYITYLKAVRPSEEREAKEKIRSVAP